MPQAWLKESSSTALWSLPSMASFSDAGGLSPFPFGSAEEPPGTSLKMPSASRESSISPFFSAIWPCDPKMPTVSNVKPSRQTQMKIAHLPPKLSWPKQLSNCFASEYLSLVVRPRESLALQQQIWCLVLIYYTLWHQFQKHPKVISYQSS